MHAMFAVACVRMSYRMLRTAYCGFTNAGPN